MEGAELLVQEGAINTITRNKPVIIFEHGLGASESNDATPTKLYNLLSDCELKVSILDNWFSTKKELSSGKFARQFSEKINYLFYCLSVKLSKDFCLFNHRMVLFFQYYHFGSPVVLMLVFSAVDTILTAIARLSFTAALCLNSGWSDTMPDYIVFGCLGPEDR